MTVYLLNDAGQAQSFREWRRLGGGYPSHIAEATARAGLHPRRLEDCTLGEIQDASVEAGRNLARQAHNLLGRPDWTVVEYPDMRPGERRPPHRLLPDGRTPSDSLPSDPREPSHG